MSKLKLCTRCVYDEQVNGISFDAEGVCVYCRTVENLQKDYGTGTPEGEARMQEIIEQIKRDGKGRKYDCVVGVSGGTDSSFMLLRAKEWGLRPLAAHYDNTWNTAIATENIRKVLSKLKVDLYTHVVDNKEADDIIRAFFKASVPDLDCATDIALAETLYRAAAKHGVKYVLEGHSFMAEGISPLGNVYMDGKYIRSVHRMFGTMPMRTYPNMDFAAFMKWTVVQRIRKIRPLWYIAYSKEEAKKRLSAELGWQDYGGHHLENRITAFHHAYYNPVKFGFDNRNNTLSALVRNGQLSRDEAVSIYRQTPYMEEGLLDYFKKRLGLSNHEFLRILRQPNKSYRDYPTYKKRFERLRPMFYVLAKANLVPMSFYLKYTSKNEI
ncbi:MAG: N-acetyl sugar amidotransferase [Myxococcales bacterium]|nr:N-acetyl sugar amidotransferase [Myxococcales bacterium]